MKWYALACLLMLLPVIATTLAAAPGAWTILPLVHPDTKLVLGIDWRKALKSPLGPTILKQVQMGGHPLLGFLESIDNVDRLVVSIAGGEAENGKPPLLVIAEGRFALGKVRQMAKADGAVARRYNEVELLVPPNATNADLHFALLNEQTILFGDGASVKNAIDRSIRGDASHESNALFSRAAALSQSLELFCVLRDPAESLPGLGIAGTTLAEDVESLELAVSLSQQLQATMSIKAGTEDAANQLATGLPALLQLAALQFANQPSLAQVARRLRTVREQNYVKIGFSMDGKLLDQSLNDLRASAAAASQPRQAQARLAPPTRETVEATAIVPERRVIRIVGLDEGVREIPYPASQPQ